MVDATSEVKVKVTVDAKQAQVELADVEKKAGKLGGGFGELGKQMAQVKERAEKQAAAIGILSTSLGNTDGVAGKVVSSVGTLAAAFGSGGALGVALIATTTALDTLIKHWDDVIAKQDKAITAQAAGAIKQLAASRTIADEVRAAEDAAFEREHGYSRAQTYGAVEERYEGRRATAAANLEAARRAAAEAGAAARSLASRDDITLDDVAAAERGTEYAAQQVAAAERAVADVARLRELDIENLKEYHRRRREENRKADDAARKARAARAQATTATVDYGDSTYSQEELAAAYRDDVATEQRLEEQRLELTRMGVDARLDERRREHEATMAMQVEELAMHAAAQDSAREAAIAMKERAGEYARSVESAAAAIGALVGQASTGQEDALEAFLSTASRVAGGAIQLEGGKLVAMGTAELLATSGASPHGWALTAGGSAIVAAGAAVSAGGPAALSQLLGLRAAGVSGASTSSAPSAPTAPLAAPGRGYGARTGGTVVNIHYGGASGPTADDGARAVVTALRRAGRQDLTTYETG